MKLLPFLGELLNCPESSLKTFSNRAKGKICNIWAKVEEIFTFSVGDKACPNTIKIQNGYLILIESIFELFK